MTPFDLSAISDEGLRREYEFLQTRMSGIVRSVGAAYGQGRKPIAFRYIDDRSFNAYAGQDADAYRIELNASVPLFNFILFARILSSKSVLPYLSARGTKVSQFELPAVLDPAKFERRAKWRIDLNEIRAFAAGSLADMCSTFVACHELGHVVSGHVDALGALEGSTRVAELMARSQTRGEAADRRQAWEYEADSVAAYFLSQFVEELVATCADNPRAAAVFSRPDGRTTEHTLAILIAASFAFFSYVQGIRRKLRQHSSHPAPMVRAHHLKNILFAMFRDRPTFDGDLFHSLLDVRLDEMIGVLAKLQLFQEDVFTDEYMDAIDAELERLEALQMKFRPFCQDWSWITWDAGR